jgi:hypothetical protein
MLLLNVPLRAKMYKTPRVGIDVYFTPLLFNRQAPSCVSSAGDERVGRISLLALEREVLRNMYNYQLKLAHPFRLVYRFFTLENTCHKESTYVKQKQTPKNRLKSVHDTLGGRQTIA